MLFLNPQDVPDLSGPLSEDFGKKNPTENLHFARVTFQFSARGLAARTVSADIGAVSGRTFQGLVASKAVLAGVAKKPLEICVKGLNATLAVGPSFFHDRPPGGECFAPLEAQAA